MKNTKLIIGKNSKIVQSIRMHLTEFDFISHNEIEQAELDKYEFIFLFSWSHKNEQENIDIISRLPCSKTIFISTTAVYSFLVRNQWATYPKTKRGCEEIILRNGGSILRIGVWGEENRKKIFGFYQETKASHLLDALNGWGVRKKRVYNAYEVSVGELNGFKANFAKTLRKISLKLPNRIGAQIPFVIIGRLIGCGNYGYSGDAISCCVDKLLIGCGVFGGYYYSANKKEIEAVVINDEEDVKLSQDGFKNTIVGNSRYGLANKWHGVFLEKNNESLVKKIVRKKIPAKAPYSKVIKARVERIEIDGATLRCISSIPSAHIHSYYGNNDAEPSLEYEILAQSIILASGALQNAKLLNTIEPVNLLFDDHELACVGEIDGIDVVGMCLKHLGPFIIYKNSIKIFARKRECLLDVRPYVSAKVGDSQKFYADSTYSIIKKLILNFSFERLNEAIFNRLGIAFKTNKFQIYVQVLVNNTIIFDGKSFQRERLCPEDWDEIKSSIRVRLPSFRDYGPTQSIDAQHTWSSCSLDSYHRIKNLISENKIMIFGSPQQDLKLDCTHHSKKFRSALLKKVIFD